MKQHLIFLLCFFTCLNVGFCQQTPEQEYMVKYDRNILKERINGVYIPIDMEDAFKELMDLSDPLSLEKFQHAPEDTIARKLHFGLGRWMSYNWNFYEGSRFSHYLKEMGISYPDDMIQFVIVSFHKYLNKKNLDLESRAQYYKDRRKKEQQEKLKAAAVIKKETRKKTN